ncbi:MAG: helix-turn-helix domain-containing protein [Candidatus Bilamarchaeaceae archaeon]
MQQVKREIAGEITLSSNPGETMRKWREIFEISQVELARFMKVSVSTISDYEGGRRKSPGTAVIHRFVEALFAIDASKGGKITQKFAEREKSPQEFFETHEFARSIPLSDFANLIKGEIITNKDIVESKKIYGYTLIDSIKVILDMPLSYFQNLYGNINERVFIFMGVSTGRSPMVVLRVSPSKPSAVVLHNIEPSKIDKLALKISEKEKLPIIVTKMPISDIKKVLTRL